ncbi:MAG: efflux RND transporter periplasmic adaptor subunit [Reyranellales bacterium]
MLTRMRLILLALLLAAVIGFVVYPKLSAAPTVGANALLASAPAQSAGPQASQPSAKQAVGGGQTGGGAGGIAVVTAIAAKQDVPITEDAVGWVEPIATVAMRTRMDGVIVGQNVQEGAIVKPGDVLFRLDDRAIQAAIAKDQASIAKDEAVLDQAKADLKRDQSLAGRNNVITEQQLELQQSVEKAGEATVAMDKATLQADEVLLSYATITAPIAGRIGVLNQTAGNLVHASDSTPLLTITQMAPVRVSYAVAESNLETYRTALRSGSVVPVQAFVSGSDKPLATGKLTFLDSSVDNASGTVTVKAEFANEDEVLWPGAYVTARTQLSVLQGATVVPVAAAQQNDKGPFVFLVKPDGTVAIQPVTINQTSRDAAVISSGVNPGDHVVIEGQLHLTNGARVVEKVASADKVATATP